MNNSLLLGCTRFEQTPPPYTNFSKVNTDDIVRNHSFIINKDKIIINSFAFFNYIFSYFIIISYRFNMYLPTGHIGIDLEGSRK